MREGGNISPRTSFSLRGEAPRLGKQREKTCIEVAPAQLPLPSRAWVPLRRSRVAAVSEEKVPLFDDDETRFPFLSLPSPQRVSAAAFRKGDSVEARYDGDGLWYAATVVETNAFGEAIVLFDKSDDFQRTKARDLRTTPNFVERDVKLEPSIGRKGEEFELESFCIDSSHAFSPTVAEGGELFEYLFSSSEN